MFSSDDDEPLAVIASKAKQEGPVNNKERRHRPEKRKRIGSDSSTESNTNDDGERGKNVRRKEKKMLDSDKIPLGKLDNQDEEVKTCEDTPLIGRDPQASQRQSVLEEETSGNDAAQLDTSRCDDKSATVTHSAQNDEHSLENSDEEHDEVGDKSSSSLSDDCEKNKVFKRDEHNLHNSSEEQVKNDKESTDSLSDDPQKNKSHENRVKGKKEKRKRRTKRANESESSGKVEVQKEKEQPKDGATIRLTKLKKMVTLAGLRIVYKKFFEDIADNDRLRVKALEKEMERRGLTPPFTMEACRAFKLQKEQEAELAELSKNHIIEIGENQKGRVTRGQRSAALATRRRGGIIFEESSDEDEEEVEEREQMKQETQNMFKNLRGIVSDDADSD